MLPTLSSHIQYVLNTAATLGFFLSGDGKGFWERTSLPIVEMFLLFGTKLITLPIIEPGLEAMSTDERTRKEMHVSIYIDLYTLVPLDVCVYVNVCGMCVHLNQWLRPFQVQGGYRVLPIPRGRCCLKQVFPCHQDFGILLFFITKRLDS